MNPATGAALFLFGAAVAALLPRPLQEDKRVTSGYKKHRHRAGKQAASSRTKGRGKGDGGFAGKRKP